PQVHADLPELAVPLGDDALPIGAGFGRERLALDPAGDRDAGDLTERRREIELADRLGDVRRRDLRRRRRAPEERQTHERIGVVRALVEQAEVALQLAVI